MLNDSNSKTSFYLGLSAGIAVFALVGFSMMLIMFLNGGLSSTDKDVAQVVDQPAPVAPSVAPPSAPTKVDVTVSADDNFRGNKNAPVTIVEFSDFQCPYCSRFHDTMKQVMENYPNQVKWVYKHFPLDSIHPYARKAAEAAECAGDQKKFWEYTDSLFEQQSEISLEFLPELATDLGLNVKKFNECLNTDKYASKVTADAQQGASIGVNGTPGNFINGQAVSGAVPYEQIKSIVDQLL